MRGLLKIPVLGWLIRIIISIFKAPRRFDALFELDDLRRRQVELGQAREEELQRQVSELRALVQSQGETLELYRNQIRMHSRLLEKQRDAEREMLERINRGEKLQNTADSRIEASEARLNDAEEQLSQIGNVAPGFLNRIIDRICADQERLPDLNRELSTHPTIWGRPDRLKIAESASVYACLFNTNSGSITVGENTFAGSRVSILAGSHDMHLSGLLRRDAEITEGCDIVIGENVWLGSGCMLLGPCDVGDNAVIAAGAVVTPGTHVPANAVYGGVPARQIRELDFSMPQDADNPHVRKALERNNGVLFVDGWSEKKICPGIPCVGHWLICPEGVLLVAKRKWTLFFAVKDAEACTLIIEGKGGAQSVPLPGGPLAIPLDLPVEDGEAERFVIRLDDPQKRLFMMLIERKEEA